jgi:peptidoglycan/LPS O-acetylase OafA/YrhL
VKDQGHWLAPSLLGGLVDSLRLFDIGISQYNSSLWTMRYELIGSIAALVTAFAIAGRRRGVLDIAITAALALLAAKVHILCALCVATVLLTKYLRHSPLRLAPAAAAALIGIGLLMGSTYKIFPAELANDPDMGRHVVRADWIIHSVGAILIFVGVHRWRRKTVADWPLARTLGRLSFPIYILHVPIFASVASGIIVAVGYGPASVSAAAALTLLTLGVTAHWLSSVDQWWLETLNRIARRRPFGRVGLPGLEPRGSDAP